MKGNLDGALTLYEYNCRISEAYYVPLQAVEICLRNTLNNCMIARYGVNWFEGNVEHLSYESQHEIYEVYEELGGMENVAPADVVAKLKFAFWVGLLAPQYDATLWRQALHKGFRATTGKRRNEVHQRLNAIRRLRNRIAHHEPIYHRDLLVVHNEILEAIGWMCVSTRDWTRQLSRVPITLR